MTLSIIVGVPNARLSRGAPDLRQTPRYKQLHGRICALRDAEYSASCELWEGDVRVCDLPFDGVLVENLIKQAINYYEDDDLDAAERTCLEIEQLMTGGTMTMFSRLAETLESDCLCSLRRIFSVFDALIGEPGKHDIGCHGHFSLTVGLPCGCRPARTTNLLSYSLSGASMEHWQRARLSHADAPGGERA
jgi:hypothetical protein